ncbi:galectin-8 [Phyllobates terribilis]|uniref:galectin-8 n=1 Tax=Phyllobates terribilis TaxID=111132 RepID=UPI003CCB2819
MYAETPTCCPHTVKTGVLINKEDMSGNRLHQTIFDPAVPYVGTIFENLEPGTMVVVHGVVDPNADRFQIDFQSGRSVKPRSDVAFHFNPRFKGSGVIVCNTLLNERWGWEEKTYQMPFQKGQRFEVVFFVLHNKFQVAANGKHLLIYKHRVNLNKIDTLSISGMVEINTIGFANHTTPPGSQPTSLALSSMSSTQASQRSMTIEIPYTGNLPDTFGPGKTVLVKGEIKKNAQRFSIDLKPNGSQDIALHLNPRMKEKVFVRNTYLSDCWGSEERLLSEFPLFPEMYFELLIYCEAHQYKVAINGQHILAYKHRFKDLAKIDKICINGDIELHDVRAW